MLYLPLRIRETALDKTASATMLVTWDKVQTFLAIRIKATQVYSSSREKSHEEGNNTPCQESIKDLKSLNKTSLKLKMNNEII